MSSTSRTARRELRKLCANPDRLFGRGDRLWRLSDSRSLLQELSRAGPRRKPRFKRSLRRFKRSLRRRAQMSDPLPISVTSFGCGVFVWNPRERRSLQDGSGMLAKDPPSALLHFVVGPGHLPFFKASKEFLDAVWRFLSGERKEMHCGC